MEAVCAGEGVAQAEVLDAVTALVDKSLVLVAEQNGAARYRLLEPIRQYGQGRLAASEEAEVVQRRHAEYYLALAEQAAPELRTPKQLEWSERLEREHDNFRAALRWAKQSGEAELGLRIGTALWYFWRVRG